METDTQCKEYIKKVKVVVVVFPQFYITPPHSQVYSTNPTSLPITPQEILLHSPHSLGNIEAFPTTTQGILMHSPHSPWNIVAFPITALAQ